VATGAQPWIETHLNFYYQMQAAVGEQVTRVLDALQATSAYHNTIVIFSSDHGDLQGSHGGMHQKWHLRRFGQALAGGR
jgi:arylsulfatase A-like enzyme